MTEAVAYKIVDAEEWRRAQDAGEYTGSAVDHADGYIHMSTEAQLAETARKHYAGRSGLRLLTVELAVTGGALKWEASRGGALFPHLYGPLPVSAVTRVQAMSVSDTGEVTLGAGAA
ncbi:DUF952 domain-containing protein [uncultured Brevundimonas sp.]|uniref:DUF952 domain-containing protein n=1 Tax=uncultured Brevundimonas sp. TaxID=213418 RepID=UPI0025CF4754|nr:DUF952 domain-containing protein [uncultured Brevundimonas sp.]